jgi:hypothetical protein
MRLAAGAIRGRKRRAISRRGWTCAGRRRGRTRTWVGITHERSSVAPTPFFPPNAQQVSRTGPADWLGALATLLGILSWGMLAAMLGA